MKEKGKRGLGEVKGDERNVRGERQGEVGERKRDANKLCRIEKKNNITTLAVDTSLGVIAGAGGKFLSAPLDHCSFLISFGETQPKRPDVTSSFKRVFSRIIQSEGLAALWRGTAANVVRYVPTTTVNFAAKGLLLLPPPSPPPYSLFTSFFTLFLIIVIVITNSNYLDFLERTICLSERDEFFRKRLALNMAAGGIAGMKQRREEKRRRGV